uniref:hypothetical protein n=1 Tax=Parerythrobacter lutipelagi TaxID=1964208 RepID=UPI0010F916E9|nr:hypothetical protein [Parerythrobacter lutipelagi]
MTARVKNIRPGQPLIMLGLVLAIWVTARMALWQSPFPLAPGPLPMALPDLFNEQVTVAQGPAAEKSDVRLDSLGRSFDAAASAPVRLADANRAMRALPAPVDRVMTPSGSVEIFAGHQVMWLAAMSQVPIPAEVATLMRQAKPAQSLVAAKPERISPDRWSVDGWLLYRPNSTGALAAGSGPLPATYGASQAGAVLNYRLAPQSGHRPAIYLRASQALAGARESEAAAGFAARPISGLPVRAQAELRLQRVNGQSDWRPAVLAVSELPAAKLPLGVRGDAYVQAGYVGGDFATPFIDGQLRVSREIADFDLGKVDAGAGIWGGAQKGASRLDVGPSAGLAIKVGDLPARLSVDYRQRIAGDAAPQSGVALTLSTSF